MEEILDGPVVAEGSPKPVIRFDRLGGAVNAGTQYVTALVNPRAMT